METERWCLRGEGHGGIDLPVFLTGRLATDGEPDGVEMDADLIAAVGIWTGRQKGGAIRKPLQKAEISSGTQPILIDAACTDQARFRADRGGVREMLFRGLVPGPDEIMLPNLTAGELGLE